MSRPFVVFLCALVALAGVMGCAGREAAAHKLFSQGQYQQVMERYPDLEIARRARAMIAEKLVEEGKYQEVIENYADTRAAYQARQALAQELFNQREYRQVLDRFPHSPLAAQARDVLAGELFNQGLFDSLLATYPESSRGREVLEARALADFDAAKRLKGEAQISALENIMRTYAATSVYKEAATLLSQARTKDKLPRKR